MRLNWVLVAFAVSALAAASGCHEDGEPPISEAQLQQASPEPDAQPAPSRTTGRGHSALGGAKRAAEGVASDLQQRSQEIADSIDDS